MNNLTKENLDALALWISELRSGRYTQANLYLHSVKGFTPLGVACHIFKNKCNLTVKIFCETNFPVSYDYCLITLPPKIGKLIGFKCYPDMISLTAPILSCGTFESAAKELEEQTLTNSLGWFK